MHRKDSNRAEEDKVISLTLQNEFFERYGGAVIRGAISSQTVHYIYNHRAANFAAVSRHSENNRALSEENNKAQNNNPIKEVDMRRRDIERRVESLLANLNTRVNNANKRKEYNGKTVLHLIVDLTENQRQSRDLLLAATSFTCRSNPELLNQIEQQNFYTPLALMLAKIGGTEKPHKNLMARARLLVYEFLDHGASLAYAVKFPCAKKGLETLLNSEKKLYMLTALHVGKGAQRVGQRSETLPVYLRQMLKKCTSLVLNITQLKRQISKEKQEAKEARKRAEEEEARSKTTAYLFGGATVVGIGAASVLTGGLASIVAGVIVGVSTTTAAAGTTLAVHVANSPAIKTEKEKENDRLEAKIAEEQKPTPADKFFAREIKALYEIYRGCYNRSASYRDAIQWLCGLVDSNYNIILLCKQKEPAYSQDVLYLIDKLLRAGMSDLRAR